MMVCRGDKGSNNSFEMGLLSRTADAATSFPLSLSVIFIFPQLNLSLRIHGIRAPPVLKNKPPS